MTVSIHKRNKSFLDSALVGSNNLARSQLTRGQLDAIKPKVDQFAFLVKQLFEDLSNKNNISLTEISKRKMIIINENFPTQQLLKEVINMDIASKVNTAKEVLNEKLSELNELEHSYVGENGHLYKKMSILQFEVDGLQKEIKRNQEILNAVEIYKNLEIDYELNDENEFNVIQNKINAIREAAIFYNNNEHFDIKSGKIVKKLAHIYKYSRQSYSPLKAAFLAVKEKLS